MKKKAKRAWRRAALAGLAAGAYFLFKDKGQLFKHYQARLTSLLGGAKPATQPLLLASVPPISRTTTTNSPARTPSMANGNVRDVLASNPPPPESGSNFTPQNDVHGPQH